MRHFKVDTTASALQLSFIKALIKREGVKYTFEPDKNGMENMGFKLGDYDIYVDDNICHADVSLLEDYEIIEINKKSYIRQLERYDHMSYEQLFEKYKVIKEERDKYAEEKLKEQREVILQDVLKEYKEDIDNKIHVEVENLYNSLLDRFSNEKCSYTELCRLYKKYIDAEIKLRIDYIKDKIINDETINNKERKYLINLCGKRKYMFSYEEYNSQLDKDIHKFKNDLVDNIVKTTLAKRGEKEYWLIMQRAGHLANIIEGKLWEFYFLSTDY